MSQTEVKNTLVFKGSGVPLFPKSYMMYTNYLKAPLQVLVLYSREKLGHCHP